MRVERIFSNSQGRIYMFLMRSAPTHSICTSATKDVYTSSYCFACDQNIFIPATKDYICPSCTSAAANDVHMRPHKVTFYRCLVVGFIFLWPLDYICKPLDIIEIMSNCNTNSQGRIYTSILQGFSKTLVAEVYIEIHMLQQKSLHARGR